MVLKVHLFVLLCLEAIHYSLNFQVLTLVSGDVSASGFLLSVVIPSIHLSVFLILGAAICPVTSLLRDLRKVVNFSLF